MRDSLGSEDVHPCSDIMELCLMCVLSQFSFLFRGTQTDINHKNEMYSFSYSKK